MDERLAALLDELHAYGVQHDAGKPDRLDRLRNLEPDTARLLALLVRATRAKAVLELGTSNGRTTLGRRPQATGSLTCRWAALTGFGSVSKAGSGCAGT